MNDQGIKIALADGDNLVRQLLSIALKTEKDLSVIGEVENGGALIELLSKVEPEILILDMDSPLIKGWMVLDYMKSKKRKIKTIILCRYFTGLSISELVHKGVRGFLAKNCNFESLISAIHEVSNSGYFFHKKVSNNTIQQLMKSKNTTPVCGESNLDRKETETLLMICNDQLTGDIAEALNVSERTVERYKRNLFEKTRAKTIAGLMMYAIKFNLLKVTGQNHQ
jgi:DNA-binding NarL/FixJ family response regulator